MQMHRMMTQGMTEMESMKLSGNIDVDFATMMRQHHAQALRMAQHELDHGKDAKMQMRAMAQRIVDSQKKEIEEFDRWLKNKQ